LTFTPVSTRLTTIAGRPYSAIESLDRILPNGTRMAGSSAPVARDSMGRTRVERVQYIPGAPANFAFIEILDPVAGYQYVLDPLHQSAHRMASSISAVAPHKSPCREDSPWVSSLKDGVVATSDWLGSRNIEGIEACGERTTLTYPPGSMFGNDRPVSAVTESWMAFGEIGKTILNTSSQPDGSKIMGGWKNVRLDEPDAALFRVPQGYRIVDETTDFTIELPSNSPPPSVQSVTALSGMPFSGEEVLASDNTLADGTHLSRHISTSVVSRDMMGRTRTESLGTVGLQYKIVIVDAVAGYRYSLDPEKQTALRIPVRVQLHHAAEASIPAPSKGMEWLGTQTIDGMVTYGERDTLTYPPGKMGGNDRPVTYILEFWRSPQLGVLLIQKSSDPSTGNSTVTLQNLKFAEPDASLFRVPDNYRIIDDH
jgi:hypothetical protein